MPPCTRIAWEKKANLASPPDKRRRERLDSLVEVVADEDQRCAEFVADRDRLIAELLEAGISPAEIALAARLTESEVRGLSKDHEGGALQWG